MRKMRTSLHVQRHRGDRRERCSFSKNSAMPAVPARSTARKQPSTKRLKPSGKLQSGQAGELQFAQGTLEIGFSSPVPVIRDLKKWALPEDKQQNEIFLDASPGCTCPVVETLRGADIALLVTEPTPFGLHDLKLVAQLAKHEMGLPCGVVINKSGDQDIIIEEFCKSEDNPDLNAPASFTAYRGSVRLRACC